MARWTQEQFEAYQSTKHIAKVMREVVNKPKQTKGDDEPICQSTLKRAEETDMKPLKKNSTIYLAGPMTGIDQLNFPAFDKMESAISKAVGCRVLNPCRLSDVWPDLEYEEFITIDFSLIEIATHILMLPNWINSPGARREYAHAKKVDTCQLMYESNSDCIVDEQLNVVVSQVLSVV